jgi:aminocarboxymuconate-semialdehyde decarboxylase
VHGHVLTGEAVEALGRIAPDSAPRYTQHTGTGRLEFEGPGLRWPELPDGLWDLAQRLRDMDAARVGVLVISVPPYMFGYGLLVDVAVAFATSLNDDIARVVVEATERLIGLAQLPLQAPEAAAAELRRAVTELRLRGAAIGTNVAGLNLDDPSLDPVWTESERLGVPILLHPATVASGARLHSYYLTNLIGTPLGTTIAAASLMCGGVIERHVSLRFTLVHGGGLIPDQLGRLDHGWRVHPELRSLPNPPSSYLSSFVFDAITHASGALPFLIDAIGAERVVMGSDYPFDMGLDQPVDAVEALQGLDDGARSAILSTNALRLFGRV